VTIWVTFWLDFL